MVRILVVLTMLAVGAGVAAAAVLARGSDAVGAAGVVMERPASGPASVAGPPPLSESVVTVQRTFVSTAGDDTNPCSATQPCRSFATAIANTTAGGEVLAIDS